MFIRNLVQTTTIFNHAIDLLPPHSKQSQQNNIRFPRSPPVGRPMIVTPGRLPQPHPDCSLCGWSVEEKRTENRPQRHQRRSIPWRHRSCSRREQVSADSASALCWLHNQQTVLLNSISNTVSYRQSNLLTLKQLENSWIFTELSTIFFKNYNYLIVALL